MRRTASIRSTRPPSSCSTETLLAQFPEGYRHLAYLQSKIGYKIKADMPGLEGPRWRRFIAGARPGSRASRLPL